jgi:DNA-binding GntR family transcriptional regulator
MAVRKAAYRITPLQLCMLQEQIDEESKIFESKDLESYIDVNAMFHIIIAQASGNSMLVNCLENILSLVFVQLIFFESFFDFDTNPSLEEHVAILKALSEHNEERCAKLMKEHIGLSVAALKLSDVGQ